MQGIRDSRPESAQETLSAAEATGRVVPRFHDEKPIRAAGISSPGDVDVGTGRSAHEVVGAYSQNTRATVPVVQ